MYTLPDAANLSIPPEVREQYQRDEFGRVLFFTTPPVQVDREGGVQGHSVRYLAEKARRAEMLGKKRKEREEQREAAECEAKKARSEEVERLFAHLEEVRRKALKALNEELAAAVAGGLDIHKVIALSAAQKTASEQHQQQEANERKRAATRSVNLGSAFYADDWDSRLVQ